MQIAKTHWQKTQPQRGGMLVAKPRSQRTKPQRGGMSVAKPRWKKNQPRRGGVSVAKPRGQKTKPQRGDIRCYRYATPPGFFQTVFCFLKMANTYTQIHLQIVFAVQGRRSLIPNIHAQTLYQYIAGIVGHQGQKLLAINGMPDHLHLLIGLRPDKALSDLMREIKANSSKFINEQGWLPGKFSWQEGFGAFSYSASQLPQVITYIERQQAHHARRTFAQEYELLLQHFGIDYNAAHVFKPAEDAA